MPLSIDKENNINYFRFLFFFYLLFYPFTLLNIPALKYIIKYPSVGISFLLLIPYSFARLKFKFHLTYIFLIFLILSYLRFDFTNSLEYIVLGGLTLIFSSVFLKEKYVKSFISCYTIIGTLVSIHALFQLFLVLTGLISWVDFNSINGVCIGTCHNFNPFFGVFDSLDIGSLRISSFFNESNRLGYFLLPLVFIHSSHQSKYSKILIFLFSFTILFTKSFATLGVLFLLRIIFYKKYRVIFIFLLLIFTSTILVQLNQYNILFEDPSNLAAQLDRGKSIASRIASFYHLSDSLIAYPFGVNQNVYEELSLIAPTYTALVYWSLIGGWLSLISIFGLISCVIFRNFNFIYNNPKSPYRGLCIGLIGYSILELFMGTGFAGLFNIMAALSLALPISSKLSWI